MKVSSASAYYNHGRWVVDCPRPECNNAYQVPLGDMIMRCDAPYDGCEIIAPIEWPVDAADIQSELALRPVAGTRNWFPKDHPLALRAGCENGQTLEELKEETDRNVGRERRRPRRTGRKR